MERVGRSLNEILYTAAGLSLFYIWLVSHIRIFALSDTLPSLPSSITSVELYGLLNAIMLFALFVLYWKRRFAPSGPAYLAFIAIALVTGHAAGSFASMQDHGASFGAAILHYVMTGAGMTLLSLEWIRLLGSLGSRSTIAVLIAASSITACILALPMLSSLFVAPFAALALPLGSLVILGFRLRERSVCSDYGSDSQLIIPYRLLVTVFVSDFACAALGALAGYVGIESGLLTNAIGYGGTAILLLVAALCLRFDFNSLIYRVAFVVMAAGCALFAMPGALSQITGMYVEQVGYRFMLALIWIMSVWLIDQRGLSANWVFPVVTCAAFVGQFVGTSSTAAIIAALGPDNGAFVASVFIAVLLPASALFLMDTRNLETGWGFSRPIDRPVTFDDRFDAACVALAERFGLTPREADVFALIAKGYSRAYISERLVLSKETVKSYANKMYAKVGVHSRQAIIELVDNEVSALENRDETILRTII